MTDNSQIKATSRRDFLQSSIAVAGGALASSIPLGAEPRKRKQPNVVFFFGEGQRADALSIAGNPLLNTPNHDRIAKEGVRFTNAFCTNALCAPARAVALTGMYSQSTGALTNESATVQLAKDIPIVTDILHESGYEVAIVGKVHFCNGAEDRYWDYYFGHNAASNNYWNPLYKEGRKGEIGPEKQYKNIYADELAVDKALQWLEERSGDKPFCLLVWFVTPHAPFFRPRRYLDLYNGTAIPKPTTFDDDLKGYPGKPEAFKQNTLRIGTSVDNNAARSLEEIVKDYYSGLTAVDDMIGKVFAYLEKKNILDETAILQGSDHGYFLGEWRLYDKRFMHEPSIRVPLMLRYPQRIKPGMIRDQMVLDIDLAPTLLDLAGIEVPRHMQGTSLLKFVEAQDAPRRNDWYYEFFEYPGPGNVPPHRGVRTERYKLIEYYLKPEQFEMYDLQADPKEIHNLAGNVNYAEIESQLKTRLAELRSQIPMHATADV